MTEDDLHAALDQHFADVRIVYNKLLRAWFVVRGAHDCPLGGSFATREEAQAYLHREH